MMLAVSRLIYLFIDIEEDLAKIADGSGKQGRLAQLVRAQS